MKNLLLLLCIGLAVPVYSQCDYLYDLNEGTVFEMESFSANNKKQGRVLNKVVNFTETGNSFKATLESKIFDKKDKEAHTGEYQMICENGVMKIDMRQFIPNESLEAFQDAEIEMSGDYLTFPSDLAVGQSLEDGNMNVSISASGGMMNMTMETLITDRKVESKEQITTPAGTFDCYKVSYKLQSATKMMGMNMAHEFRNTDWISEGVGVVRTETYNSKGKLTSYTVLTRFEK